MSSPSATATPAYSANTRRMPPAPVETGPPALVREPGDDGEHRRDEQADADADAEEPAVPRGGVHDDLEELLIDDVLVVGVPAGGIAAPGCHVPIVPPQRARGAVSRRAAR